MASRRIQRMLAAFGAALTAEGSQRRQNQLIMDRQAAENKAIADRQAEAEKRASVRDLTENLRLGKIQPTQLTDTERTSLGGNVLQLTPPNEILSKPLFENLRTAKSSGEVPSEGELIQQRLSLGPVRDISDISNILNTRGATQQRLRDKEAYEADAASAAEYGKTYNQGMAKEDVAAATHPASVKREAETAEAQAFARSEGDVRSKIKNASEMLRIETDKARMIAKIQADSQRAVTQMAAVDKANQTAMQGLSVVGNLYKSWLSAKDEIKLGAQRMGALGGPAAYDFRASKSYVGMPPKVRLYYQAVEKSLPALSRLAGEVGNLADLEQVRQRYGVPSAWDAVQGTGEDKLETLLAFGLSMGKLAQMNNDPKVIAMAPEERFKLLEQVVEDAKKGLASTRQVPMDDERARLLKALGK